MKENPTEFDFFMISEPNSKGISIDKNDAKNSDIVLSSPAMSTKHHLHHHIKIPKTYKLALLHALKGGSGSFAMGYGLRSSFLFLLKLLQVFRGKESLIYAIKTSFVSSDALTYASSIGGFSFIWKILSNSLRIFRQKSSRWNGAIAGGIASTFALALLPKATRTSFAIQMFLRALQLLYNYHKKKGRIHFPAGDSILFAVSCVPIMYSFVLEHKALPKAYFTFMTKISEAPAAALELTKTVSQRPYDLSVAETFPDITRKINGTLENVRVSEKVAEAYKLIGGPLVVPCSIIHAKGNYCISHNIGLFFRVIWNSLPLHIALNVVPMIILKRQVFLKSPSSVLQKSFRSSLQSSVFLSVFVVIFKGMHCIHRSLTDPLTGPSTFKQLLSYSSSQKAWLLFTGFLCSYSAISAEQKQRRSELALYVVPKAMDSLYYIFNKDEKLSRKIPKSGDFFIGIFAFSIIMGFYEAHSDCISPTLNGILNRLIGHF